MTLATCVAWAGWRPARGQPGEDITVPGIGVATAEAEYAVVSVGVYADGPTADAAAARTAAPSVPVRQALLEFGVAERGVRTGPTVRYYPPDPAAVGGRTEPVYRAEDT